MNVCDYLEKNVKGLFDVVIRDHVVFHLHTKTLKIIDTDNILSGKRYLILAGGSRIASGVVEHGENMFPVEDVPFGLVSEVTIELYIFDVCASDNVPYTFDLDHESFECEATEVDIVWKSDAEATNRIYLRFICGFCGLSSDIDDEHNATFDDAYIQAHKKTTVFTPNGVLSIGVSHLDDNNEYHPDAFAQLCQYNTFRVYNLFGLEENPEICYETLKLPTLARTSNVATFDLSETMGMTDGVSNMELLTKENVVSVRLEDRSLTYKCTDLIPTPNGVRIADFHNQHSLNCNRFRHICLIVTFSQPLSDEVWLKLDRQLFAYHLRTPLFENKEHRVDMSTVSNVKPDPNVKNTRWCWPRD